MLDPVAGKLEQYLDLLGARQKLVASNIASADTPGFKTKDLDFQTELARANINMPIIFITGHGDIPQSVRVMKAGAVKFLTKPLREQDLLDAVQLALERDRSRREAERFKSKLLERFEALTPREQEVMAFVTTGLMNKQIAAEIGTTEITVKVHRSNVMRKTGASPCFPFSMVARPQNH